MRIDALLAAAIVVAATIAGCSDPTASPEQSSGGEGSTGQDQGVGGDGGDASAAPPSQTEGHDPTVSSTPAPTVEAQAPGSPLVVAGAELASPEGWQVSGVSSDDSSEVVSATSDDGQFIALRSVRTDVTVEEQIAEALEADAEQTVEAAELEVDGETLRGVETALTASGGDAVQLQYFVRRGDSLITIDIVTTAGRVEALASHVEAGLTWG